MRRDIAIHKYVHVLLTTNSFCLSTYILLNGHYNLFKAIVFKSYKTELSIKQSVKENWWKMYDIKIEKGTQMNLSFKSHYVV